ALGMSHDEFFNTYFTGQKELAVMSALKPVDRRKFLARVLGYERLEIAQVRVRERRNALAAELQGLEAGLPDPAELVAHREAAQQRLAAARGGGASRGAGEARGVAPGDRWARAPARGAGGAGGAAGAGRGGGHRDRDAAGPCRGRH